MYRLYRVKSTTLGVLFLSLALGLGFLFGVGFGSRSAWAEPVSPPADRQVLGAHFVSYTLNPGTAIQVLLQTPVSTGINQVGDPVEGIMSHNIYLGEEKILPQSTRFMGVITQLEPAMQGRNGILAVQFTSVLLSNGEKLPIQAHVRTENASHAWGGEVTRGTKPMLSTQRVWGIGEYNRVVFGGPRAMGTQVEMESGAHWTLILDQPLTLVKPAQAE